MASSPGSSKEEKAVAGKYSDIDEYGFMRPKDFDYKSYENFFSEYISVLNRRKLRWNQILKDGKKKKVKLDAKVKRFCRKGIPMEHRKMVWMSVSGAEKKLRENPGLYEAILAREDDSEQDRDLRSSIEIDLERTFPDNIYFRSRDKKNDGKLPALERVLLAIGRHKNETGYCQGMNYIIALLLLVLDDEESVFWLFVTVLENYLPDYYSSTMFGLRTDMEVLTVLVKERFPSVAICLERESMNWLLLSSKWFICLYADILPTENIVELMMGNQLISLRRFITEKIITFMTVLRIWDCFFTEGPKILFRVALKLIKIRANKVKTAEDMPAIIAAFQSIGKEDLVTECHTFMEECFKEDIPLRMSRITTLRNSCKEKVAQEDADAKQRKENRQRQ